MNPFDIGKNLRQMIRNVRQFINKGIRDFDMNEGQFEYFFMIYKHTGINQKELAEMMCVSKASVTKAIKKLLAAGLIARLKDKNDLRHYGLYITEAGKKFAKQFDDYEARIKEVMFSGISDEEIRLFSSIVTRMKENSRKL